MLTARLVGNYSLVNIRYVVYVSPPMVCHPLVSRLLWGGSMDLTARDYRGVWYTGAGPQTPLVIVGGVVYGNT